MLNTVEHQRPDQPFRTVRQGRKKTPDFRPTMARPNRAEFTWSSSCLYPNWATRQKEPPPLNSATLGPYHSRAQRARTDASEIRHQLTVLPVLYAMAVRVAHVKPNGP